MSLDHPSKFPERSFYHIGETGKLAQETLARWVGGGTFHEYGLKLQDEPEYEPGAWMEYPARLEYEGRLVDGYMSWSLFYRRAGLPDAYGSNAGYSTAEDAAYAALTMIEEHERDVYEQNLVVGTA